MKNPYLMPIKELYEAHANPKNAGPMKKYLKDNFEFYGIKTPERKVLYKVFLEKWGLPRLEDLPEIIKELWDLPQREYQYFALYLLERIFKKAGPGIIELCEYLVVRKSWWDTVDGIAGRLVGPLFQRHPALIKPYTGKWLESGNIWLQRAAILFQLHYKDKTDEKLLFDSIHMLSPAKEFFIQKAIGWALREYSKTYPERVKKFVQETSLAPLSKREALKVINKNK